MLPQSDCKEWAKREGNGSEKWQKPKTSITWKKNVQMICCVLACILFDFFLVGRTRISNTSILFTGKISWSSVNIGNMHVYLLTFLFEYDLVAEWMNRFYNSNVAKKINIMRKISNYICQLNQTVNDHFHTLLFE